MQTQKELVMLHPRKGIMNIDVLSFERLAFRVMEGDRGFFPGTAGRDGKSMVLRESSAGEKRVN